MIVPWFGPLPEWMPLYRRNIQRLGEHGYDFLFDHDLEGFRRRAKDTIGVEFPGVWGGSKIHDYRATFGAMYADEIVGYDFWGHTDLDCVYGRVERFATDDLLEQCDLHTDGNDYVNGPWSLYRADRSDLPFAFGFHPEWREILEQPETTGWVETSYSRLVRGMLGDRMVVTRFQHRNLDDFREARLWADGSLTEGPSERLLAHFRRTKVYPPRCR
jgi:hypothetical protein